MDRLTWIERDTLDRCCRRGLTSKEAAKAGGVTFNTVQTHRRRILRKLGVPNLAAACYRYAEIAPPKEEQS